MWLDQLAVSTSDPPASFLPQCAMMSMHYYIWLFHMDAEDHTWGLTLAEQERLSNWAISPAWKVGMKI